MKDLRRILLVFCLVLMVGCCAAALVACSGGEALTGISAQNVTKVYDGEEASITVEGTESGDKVQYKNSENGVYKAANVKYTDVGEYTVWYKVERGGSSFEGSATITITPKELTVAKKDVEISRMPGETITVSKGVHYDLNGAVASDNVDITPNISLDNENNPTKVIVTYTNELRGTDKDNYTLKEGGTMEYTDIDIPQYVMRKTTANAGTVKIADIADHSKTYEISFDFKAQLNKTAYVEDPATDEYTGNSRMTYYSERTGDLQNFIYFKKDFHTYDEYKKVTLIVKPSAESKSIVDVKVSEEGAFYVNVVDCDPSDIFYFKNVTVTELSDFKALQGTESNFQHGILQADAGDLDQSKTYNMTGKVFFDTDLIPEYDGQARVYLLYNDGTADVEKELFKFSDVEDKFTYDGWIDFSCEGVKPLQAAKEFVGMTAAQGSIALAIVDGQKSITIYLKDIAFTEVQSSTAA